MGGIIQKLILIHEKLLPDNQGKNNIEATKGKYQSNLLAICSLPTPKKLFNHSVAQKFS